MTEFCNVVPWYNSNEWREVYNKVYVEENEQEALNMLLIWKARCPSLPSGVESTLTFLEVNIQDFKNNHFQSNDLFLRLAYSSAIMRFVNHMLDTNTAKGSSLYHAAKKRGVPEWIIDMRHDAAHSSNLPSVDVLREASQICLKWLKKNYWDEYEQCIQSYVTSEHNSENINRDLTRVMTLLNFCLSLSVCMVAKIKKLSDIPDVDVRESIINDTRDLFGDQIDLSNLKTVSITSLVNIMNVQSKKIIKCVNNKAALIAKALLREDSLFLDNELLHYSSSYDFTYRKRLNVPYVKSFEFLLVLLHSNDFMLDFILELVNITQKNDNKDMRLLAALWLSEILKALKKSKDFRDKMNGFNSRDMRSRKREDLISLYNHWFPNDKVKGLMLDLLKPPPDALMNINSVQPIISSYNPYLTYFINDMLNLLEPQLPKIVKNQVCKLASIILSSGKLEKPSARIYTIEDLQCGELKMCNSLMEAEDEEHTRAECKKEEKICEPKEFYPEKQGLWTLSTITFDWSASPIGCIVPQNLLS